MLFRKKLNKVISVFLLAVLAIQVNSVAWIQFWFYLNQKNLSETVCERVVVKCNAGCYLSKQIEKETAQTPVAPKPGRSDFKIKDKTDPAVFPFALVGLVTENLRFSSSCYLSKELRQSTNPPEQPPRFPA